MVNPTSLDAIVHITHASLLPPQQMGGFVSCIRSALDDVSSLSLLEPIVREMAS